MVAGLVPTRQPPRVVHVQGQPRLPRHARSRSRRSRGTPLIIAVVVAAISAGAATWVTVDPPVEVISGSAHAADPVGKSDEDQIHDVLQMISDAYNRQDVKSAEMQLCPGVASQWSAELESVWMRFRLRHGAFQFIINSTTVSGVVANVTGTQIFANDAKPKSFTAHMGHGVQGWKMCSST